MIDLIQSTNSDATIKIYDGKIVLSAKACVLLALTPVRPRIRFRVDRKTGKVYVCHSDNESGLLTRKRTVGQTRYINSSFLSTLLTEALGSAGTHRIKRSNAVIFDGITHYEIEKSSDMSD